MLTEISSYGAKHSHGVNSPDDVESKSYRCLKAGELMAEYCMSGGRAYVCVFVPETGVYCMDAWSSAKTDDEKDEDMRTLLNIYVVGNAV